MMWVGFTLHGPVVVALVHHGVGDDQVKKKMQNSRQKLKTEFLNTRFVRCAGDVVDVRSAGRTTRNVLRAGHWQKKK